jgi:S1-C subfamily serine protease
MRMTLAASVIFLLPGLLRAADAADLHTRLLFATAWVRAATEGVGAGWVVDAKRRWLITNLHVVGDQDRVEAIFVVTKDGKPISERSYYLENQKRLHEQGRAVRGKVILRRLSSDLALIELDKLPEGITALPLAQVMAQCGEHVHSIGHRRDAEALWCYCAGDVRQSGRLTDGYFWHGKKLAAGVRSLIVQAPILPGDSGGPLVNDSGEVVGVVAGLRPAPLAAIAIQVDEVRELLAEATKMKTLAVAPPLQGTAIYRQLLAATVWVRPTATEGRAAGWIVDKQRRLVLTTSSGAGPSDLVDVVFPRTNKGELVPELHAYADRIGLRQDGTLIRGLVLMRDPKRDLALIELEALPPTAAELALASAEVSPGDTVHTVAHPSGVEMLWLYATGAVRQTAHVELVASSNGEAVKAHALLLQVPHQAGSSGGAVVNDKGQVVGMLAAREAAQQQLGYAIAAAELESFLKTTRPLFAPGTAEEFHRRGLFCCARGALHAAIVSFVAELERGTTIEAVRELADALARAGSIIMAEAAQWLAPGLNLQDRARRTMYAAYYQSKHVLAECDDMLKLDRKIARSYLARSLIVANADALPDLDEAIFLEPSLVEAYRRRADVHYRLGDLDKSLADLTRAIELDAYELATIRKRASLYMERNEPKRAVADCERLIDLAPRDAASYRSLAAAWLAQGDEAKAIPGLIAALRWQQELAKSIFADVLKHGAELARRWPDDAGKKADWYRQALEALRPVVANEGLRRQIEAALRDKQPGWNAKEWGDELEKRIRALAK